MATKTDKTPNVAAITTVAAASIRLGDQVQVVAPPDAVLINNETGAPFEPGVPTLQTVTVTLLRRLADGDLSLAG